MSTLELKQELHEFINDGDEKFIKMFYEMAKAYMTQKRKDKMIAQGEDDIEKGHLHTLKEAKEIMDK